MNTVIGDPLRFLPSVMGPPVAGDAVATKPASEANPEALGVQFEKLFLSMLVKELKRSLPGGQMLPAAGAGYGAFETLLDQRLADAVGEKGTGIGDAFARMLEQGRMSP